MLHYLNVSKAYGKTQQELLASISVEGYVQKDMSVHLVDIRLAVTISVCNIMLMQVYWRNIGLCKYPALL